MNIGAFSEWLAAEVARRHREAGRMSAAAAAREHMLSEGRKLAEKALARARASRVHAVNVEGAALAGVRATVSGEIGTWSPEMMRSAGEIEERLKHTVTAQVKRKFPEAVRARAERSLRRLDPQWGGARAWRPPLRCIEALAGLEEDAWEAFDEAPAWAAREGLEREHGKGAKEGYGAWLGRWLASEAPQAEPRRVAKVLERWRWPSVRPPLRAAAAWADAGRAPRSAAEWGASVEVEALGAEPIEVTEIARRARRTQARIVQAVRTEAGKIVEDMLGPSDAGEPRSGQGCLRPRRFESSRALTRAGRLAATTLPSSDPRCK